MRTRNEEQFQAKKIELMEKCSKVYYSGVRFGTMNALNSKLLDKARELGKEIISE